MGARFQSAGPGAQGTFLPGLPESDTLSVSCESSPRESLASWSTTSTPSSGLTCSLLTLLPFVPEPGVPHYMPNAMVPHREPFPVTWALGPGATLEPGSGHGGTVPPPGPHARQEGGCLQGWWQWTALTNQEAPAPGPQVSRQGSQQVTDLLDHMAGRKQNRGPSGFHLSVCLPAGPCPHRSPPGCVCSGRSHLSISPAP